MFGTKTAIKAAYIANLQAAYPFYAHGSRPLALANEATDKALAVKMKLEGGCWFSALASNGVQKSATMKMLAELPA